jgi:RNA polymerase-interacting CarD/CdnL/TRCF family regulator
VEGIIADAEELKPGDRVVYPNQGVCCITGVEQKEIAGQTLELVRMEREEDGATVMVPKGKVPSIGLRKVATADQIEGVIHYLAASYDDPELDWKIRHRDNADRLIAGGVLGVAEVVKGLHSLSRIRPLPTKEREQYDNARHLLVHEIAVSLAIPPALAEDYIDYALMPPSGVTFKLKPPPKPVVLPTYPSYRPKRTGPAPGEEEDDLGLGDLGLGLGLELELDENGVAKPVVVLPVDGEAVEEQGEQQAESTSEDHPESEPIEAASVDDQEAEVVAPPPKKPAAKKAKPSPKKQAPVKKAPTKKAPAKKAKAKTEKKTPPAKKAKAPKGGKKK